MNSRISVFASATILALSLVGSTTEARAATSAPKPVASKVFDPNAVHLQDLIDSIQCLPHEPETTSDVDASHAIAVGDADLNAGHCMKALADYKVAVDANPKDADALFHHIIAAYGILGSSTDQRLVLRVGEAQYHDTDLAIAAAPNNPVFLVLRASSRVSLIGAHVQSRAVFGNYVGNELKNSYDDCTNALTLAPKYGQAYATRWMIDKRRQDDEQANYDLAQSKKFDPKSADRAQQYQHINEEHVADNMRALNRSRMAMAEATMGLGVATGGITVIPLYP